MRVQFVQETARVVRRGLLGLATAGLFSVALAGSAAADFDRDVAAAGNGGVANASANGGAVAVGDVNSGGNAGNAIGVGDTRGGGVVVDGGMVRNSTEVSISADGGAAIADASGGNDNVAIAIDAD